MISSDQENQRLYFQTLRGDRIPAVTEAEMREVDRLAGQVFSLGVLQMMENAGRNLALHAMQLCQRDSRILVLAGPGGNGGGGLSCARHLHNHGHKVDLVLSHQPEELSAPATSQFAVLQKIGLKALPAIAMDALVGEASLIIDALLGYSLKGAPRGAIRDMIQVSNDSSLPILSLDLPSGTEATDGTAPGDVITPVRTLTLALPKQGQSESPGRLFLADIGLPPELYAHIGLDVDPIFSDQYWLELRPATKVA